MCTLLHNNHLTHTHTQTYGRELSEAYEWIQKFKVSRKEAELHQVCGRVCVYPYP